MKCKPFPVPTPDQALRFWSHVDKTETCWLWTGARRSTKGFEYGIWRLPRYGRLLLVHRVAYLLHHGALDSKLTIDHICESKLCVNPAHLEQVTQSENTLRAYRRHPERLRTPEEKKAKNRENQRIWRERNPERAKEQAQRSYEKVGRARRAAAYQKEKAFFAAWYPKKTEDQGYCETLRAESDISDLLA